MLPYIQAQIFPVLIEGENLGVFIQNPSLYRDVIRTMTSVIAVLPNPKLWSKDEILIVTPFKNYTVHDYPEYFSDSNYLTGTYIQTNIPVIL